MWKTKAKEKVMIPVTLEDAAAQVREDLKTGIMNGQLNAFLYAALMVESRAEQEKAGRARDVLSAAARDIRALHEIVSLNRVKK